MWTYGLRFLGPGLPLGFGLPSASVCAARFTPRGPGPPRRLGASSLGTGVEFSEPLGCGVASSFTLFDLFSSAGVEDVEDEGKLASFLGESLRTAILLKREADMMGDGWGDVGWAGKG